MKTKMYRLKDGKKAVEKNWNNVKTSGNAGRQRRKARKSSQKALHNPGNDKENERVQRV